jgi:O-antigen/teichoic acid export membrane protein
MDSMKSIKSNAQRIFTENSSRLQRSQINPTESVESSCSPKSGHWRSLRYAFLIVIFLSTLLIAAWTINAHRLERSAGQSLQPINHANIPPESNSKLLVYYTGPPDNVLSALKLHTGFTLVDSPDQAQVLVLNGCIPDQENIQALYKSGIGVVLILGPNLTAEQVSPLLGGNLVFEFQDQPLSLVTAGNRIDPITKDIVWNSAPQIRQRFDPRGLPSSLRPLIIGFEQSNLILGQTRLGSGVLYLFTPFLDQANPQFKEWAYFNYFIYYLTERAGGEIPLSFADYPYSPLPHSRDRTFLIAILAGILVLSLVIFLIVRRYSLSHPEALDALVIDRQEFEIRQAETDWNQIGFHRPLGGFLLAFMLGLVLFIPLIIYQNLVLPVYILPSAQALGIWGRVVQFFNFLWLLLDMGTSAAFIKFFAEYRVHDPRKAIQYGQIFVWWQAISGAIQVAVVILLASTLLPQSAYALYAWSIILHTFIQIPGFFQVMRHALMAWQRFDYAQILEIGLYLVFPILTQPVLVTMLVIWGRNHPVFGPSMGGLLGLGLAAYATEGLTFLIGLWLYRRVGYNARLLFLAHFDWATVLSAFRFGVFEMLGSVAWALGQALEIVVTQTRLINYTEIWGNWTLAQNFIFAFNVLQTLFNNLMPSISEAISNTRKALSQYYSAMAYQWGGIISAFIAAVLLAVADRFILGASGPEFVRAAAYTIPLVIWGAIQYPSWVGDTVQLGSNKPYLKASMVAGEQIIRILIAWILLERYQINALIIAYFVGLLTKDILAYFINHHVCFPQRFFLWNSLAAPFLAGGAHYLVLRWITGLIWQGDQLTSVLIFLIGILFSYPLFAFFYGLFGGWDEDTLSELKHAAELSSFMRLLAFLFWRATSIGAHISPLHNRFRIDIRQAALLEAQSLTDERVAL